MRHLTEIERNCFAAGAGVTDLPHYYSDEDPDGDFHLPDPVTADDVGQAFDAWRAECDRSRRIVAEADSLDQANAEGSSLRWVLVSVLREYARHNGHADLLREVVLLPGRRAAGGRPQGRLEFVEELLTTNLTMPSEHQGQAAKPTKSARLDQAAEWARLRSRVGWWGACGWGWACQHRPARSLHPGRGGGTTSHPRGPRVGPLQVPHQWSGS